jgi:hypothetical protein
MINTPTGDDFVKFMLKNNISIDKTSLIVDLIESRIVSKALFSRPRRWGKSVNLSVLNCFFQLSSRDRKR